MLTYSAMAGCRIWYLALLKEGYEPVIYQVPTGRVATYSPLPTWHLRVKGFTSAVTISRCSLPCGQSHNPLKLIVAGVAMAAGVWMIIVPGSWLGEPGFLIWLSCPVLCKAHELESFDILLRCKWESHMLGGSCLGASHLASEWVQPNVQQLQLITAVVLYLLKTVFIDSFG